MRPYLEKTHHKKGLVEWLKVMALSSNPSITKKRKEKGTVVFYSYNAMVLNNEDGIPPVILLQEARQKICLLMSLWI
jgi:hypothetical protein